MREGFRHQDLRRWVLEHRAELVRACLVLGQAWLAAGRPVPSCSILGMFESWSRVLGGILETVGVGGFLRNLEELYRHTDTEGAEIREFLAAWWERHRDAEVATAQLFELATAADSLLDIDAKTEQGRKVRLGKLLADLRDRRYALDDRDVTVRHAGSRARASLWRLESEQTHQPSPSSPRGGSGDLFVGESGESRESFPSTSHARARARVGLSEQGETDSPDSPDGSACDDDGDLGR